ncbi:MAG: sialidase family protein [Chloroflexi bacterium]|nr:sialidase family protein [Chloroflexota bacterium]
MLKHTRSVAHKVYDIWRSPGRFTKNPDIVALPSGRYLLVYSDVDAHWSLEDQILVILASDDGGKTWFKHREIDRADIRKGQERMVTPRLSRLKDGRLVVIIDHNDHSHFHEDQPPGNWLYWSHDNGDNWSNAHDSQIIGFEPDRIVDLPDGTLGVTAHVLRGSSQEFAQDLWVSADGGRNWSKRGTIAHDGYHRFCEGAVVWLHGGRRLACIMRENHSGGLPSFVAFSDDQGHSWSTPQMLPFALHRPYAKELADGRTLVTGRHVNGGLGTYAWVGDMEAEAGAVAIGGPRRKYAAALEHGTLVIHNRLEHECRYTLLPPESTFSLVDFEAELRVEASAGDEPVAFMSLSRFGQLLQVAPDHIALRRNRHFDYRAVDMTQYRTIRLVHERGWLRIEVDGETALHACVFRESLPANDFHGGDPLRRTQFGQFSASGRSYWRTVSYRLRNATLDDYAWSWRADSGAFPDQYQRERMIQIHANHPAQQPWPDHGYSSWIQRDDGGIFLVDYSNAGDSPDTAHLVGVTIDLDDIA